MDITNQVITAFVGIGIVGFAYLVDLVGGIIKVNTTTKLQWSWKKFFKDFLKLSLATFDTLAFVVLLNLLTWYGTKTGTDLTVLAGISYPLMIAAIFGGAVYYSLSAGKNLIAFWNQHNTSVTIDPDKLDADGIAADTIAAGKNILRLADNWFEQFGTSKQAADARKKAEVEGGLGAIYSVPIDSYDSFRNTVNGRGYDIDGAYSFQCWDGAALLWQQIGRSLSTGGTGGAKGTWQVAAARAANAGNDFELIYNLADVRRGDIVVLANGQYGHIAFADQNGASVMNLLGQNQGGDGNGRVFNVMSIGMSSFVGAFRFKRWIKAPVPATPGQTYKPVDAAVVAAVKRGDYGNDPQRRTNLAAAGYDPDAVQAAVNSSMSQAPVQQPAAPTTSGFAVGDIVVPTNLVDYNGTRLHQWDPNYTVTEVRGDRAVLMARGQVWAAMNTAHIQKA